MEILESLKQVKSIVEERAKYQKVMLIFDEQTSEMEVNSVYEQIKDICVFNKLEINQDLNEIYNGYKLIIFCVSATSFLKFNYNIDEFVNVFITKDENILPFYLNNLNYKSAEEKFLCALNPIKDINAIASIKFNKFYNYLSELINFQFSSSKFSFFEDFMLNFNSISSIANVDENLHFIDIEIAKKTGMDYSKIILIDFILICGFMCVISSINNHTLELVDTYKAMKDDLNLIDKFYALQTNQTFIKIVELNFNFLLSACNKTKQEILNLISNFDEKEIEEVACKIKSYAKETDSIISYLYLYNIFGY